MALLNKNLVIAEAAVAYVDSKMTLGASNKPIDLAHARMRYEKLDFFQKLRRRFRPELTRQTVNKHRGPEVLKLKIPGLLSHVLADGDRAEKAGVGNCGEQAHLAFKYLYNRRDTDLFAVVSFGPDHALIVMGVPPEKLRGVFSVKGVPPGWPKDAVICDPWYHEWFTMDDWSRKVSQILKATAPNQDHVTVEIQLLTSIVRGNALPYKSSVVDRRVPEDTEQIKGLDPKIYAAKKLDDIMLNLINRITDFNSKFGNTDIFSSLNKPEIEKLLGDAEVQYTGIERDLREIFGRYYDRLSQDMLDKYAGITGEPLKADTSQDRVGSVLNNNSYVSSLGEQLLMYNGYATLKFNQLKVVGALSLIQPMELNRENNGSKREMQNQSQQQSPRSVSSGTQLPEKSTSPQTPSGRMLSQFRKQFTTESLKGKKM
jgi:hypothetical protein